MSIDKHPFLEADSWLDPDEEAPERVREIIEGLSGEEFDNWRRERQFRENIEDGNSYYNKTGYVPDPERHSPSKLTQCQRKMWYKTFNAPEEEGDPSGIFWIGERFEEEIAMPFLQDYAKDINENNYVQNSMWTDYIIDLDGVDTPVDELHIKGETDPVIVDRRGNPLVVTEVKNKQSLDSKKFQKANPEPDKHHKAQIHAYMVGLSKSFERSIDKGIIIYGSRTTHELLPIVVEFDEDFWENTVLQWATEQSEYRLNDELPPIDPEYSWECRYCDYRQRCGMGDDPGWVNNPSDYYPDDAEWEDVGADGFLPLTEYPFEKVIEYLQAHGPKGAKLTPTLAHQHDTLREKFNVHDWVCETCTQRFPFKDQTGTETIPWDGNPDNPPTCPECSGRLQGPMPSKQHH